MKTVVAIPAPPRYYLGSRDEGMKGKIYHFEELVASVMKALKAAYRFRRKPILLKIKTDRGRSKMGKWEYLTRNFDHISESTLDSLGKDRWRLVGYVDGVFVFERRKAIPFEWKLAIGTTSIFITIGTILFHFLPRS